MFTIEISRITATIYSITYLIFIEYLQYDRNDNTLILTATQQAGSLLQELRGTQARWRNLLRTPQWESAIPTQVCSTPVCDDFVMPPGSSRTGFFSNALETFIYLAVPGLSCSMWDRIPWKGLKPRPLALVMWSLSHWTTREVPGMHFRKLTLA